MNCPFCVEQGISSKVYPETGRAVTDIAWTAYYDEAGAYHTHDPNGYGPVFTCSRGHQWVDAYKPCRSCDYGAQPLLRLADEH